MIRLREIASGLFVCLLLACAPEEQMQPLPEYETADLRARAFNFQVYPGARLLERHTELLRKAHTIMNPNSTAIPPMVVYETDAPLEEVIAYYAHRYGYERVADAKAFAAIPSPAYRTEGDLRTDLQTIEPILRELKLAVDLEKVSGAYRGANFAAKENLPRVTLQRPHFDGTKNEVVDRTLILLVRD